MKIYTVDEVAEQLKVHPVTVRVWIKEGKIKAVRLGRAIRVNEEELDKIKKGE